MPIISEYDLLVVHSNRAAVTQTSISQDFFDIFYQINKGIVYFTCLPHNIYYGTQNEWGQNNVMTNTKRCGQKTRPGFVSSWVNGGKMY